MTGERRDLNTKRVGDWENCEECHVKTGFGAEKQTVRKLATDRKMSLGSEICIDLSSFEDLTTISMESSFKSGKDTGEQ